MRVRWAALLAAVLFTVGFAAGRLSVAGGVIRGGGDTFRNSAHYYLYKPFGQQKEGSLLKGGRKWITLKLKKAPAGAS